MSYWHDVGEFAYELGRRGITIHLIDAWIAAAAIHHHCTLWSLDKHFRQIAEKSSLKLHTHSEFVTRLTGVVV